MASCQLRFSKIAYFSGEGSTSLIPLVIAILGRKELQ